MCHFTACYFTVNRRTIINNFPIPPYSEDRAGHLHARWRHRRQHGARIRANIRAHFSRSVRAAPVVRMRRQFGLCTVRDARLIHRRKGIICRSLLLTAPWLEVAIAIHTGRVPRILRALLDEMYRVTTRVRPRTNFVAKKSFLFENSQSTKYSW